ncbi:MAG TPA: hypothetical protein VFW71_11810 [Actinomycetota bacterium]|nr:hypothetical protein [Actinomycetota bacterium]
MTRFCLGCHREYPGGEEVVCPHCGVDLVAAPESLHALLERFVFTGWAEWDSVTYLLASPLLAGKLGPFVDVTGYSVDIEALVEASGAWSHAEQLFVALAADLWRATGAVSVRELVATLDDANFARALAAIEIARGARVGAGIGGAP